MSEREFSTGDHVCWTYASDDEHFRVLSRFFSQGAAAGEKLMYLAPSGRERRVLEYLSDAGERPHELVRRGQLVIGPIESAYIAQGYFRPTQRLRQYEKQVIQAQGEGFAGLRVAGDAAVLLNHPAVNGKWAGYELRADLMATRLPLVALCGYDLRDCDGLDLGAVKAVHARGLHAEGAAAPCFRLHAAEGATLALEGEVDISCAATLQELLLSALEDVEVLRIDVSRVTFIDVAGVRALTKVAQAAQGGSCVSGVSPTFRKLWRLLDLERLDRVHLDGQEARVTVPAGDRRNYRNEAQTTRVREGGNVSAIGVQCRT